MIKTTQLVNYRYGIEPGYGGINVIVSGISLWSFVHNNNPESFQNVFNKALENVKKEWLEICHKNNIEVVIDGNNDYRVKSALATLLTYTVIRTWDEQV
jgi:hypothetical protein